MAFVEENDKKRDIDEEITSERLTIYRILDLYNLINKENQFAEGIFKGYKTTRVYR